MSEAKDPIYIFPKHVAIVRIGGQNWLSFTGGAGDSVCVAMNELSKASQQRLTEAIKPHQ